MPAKPEFLPINFTKAGQGRHSLANNANSLLPVNDREKHAHTATLHEHKVVLAAALSDMLGRTVLGCDAKHHLASHKGKWLPEYDRLELTFRTLEAPDVTHRTELMRLDGGVIFSLYDMGERLGAALPAEAVEKVADANIRARSLAGFVVRSFTDIGRWYQGETMDMVHSSAARVAEAEKAAMAMPEGATALPPDMVFTEDIPTDDPSLYRAA